MKPIQIFGFFLALFLCLGLLSLIYPKDGIALGEEYTLDYPRLTDIFVMDSVEEKDFSAIIDSEFDIDSLEIVENKKRDSVRQIMIKDSIRQWQLKMHYPENDKSVLYPLFQKLDKAKNRETVRVMHYGDSQIEGDRISGYLRYKLQSKFGGYGPGLLPATPLVKTAAIKYSSSENWNRYTLYGKKDSTVTHSNYGPLASFGRFTPTLRDSILMDTTLVLDTTIHKAWLRYEKSNITYKRTKVFNSFEMMFGNLSDSLNVRLFANDSLVQEYRYGPTESTQVIKKKFSFNPESIQIEFEGKDSPDIYAVNLEGGPGIIVDNIALRGSSGTLFKRMGHQILSTIYADFNIQLLLLQFGGNVMPYIEDEKECEQYGRWFESQLRYLKTIAPEASIVVIGPSDMGKFEKGEYTSYELLPNVRDALKIATFKQGGAYWDMMEAMGGAQSMKAWVEANPPLASKDYIHFNHKGAGKVAQMFYNALIQDYNEYKEKGL